MKSSFLLFLLLSFFSLSVFAQTGPNEASLGLRVPFSDEPAVAGLTRSRAVANTFNDAAETPSAAVATVERQIFALLNKKRAERGLEPLVWSNAVASVARLHSEDMAAHKFFSHKGFDGSMVDDRADRVGLYGWQAIGENIAYLRGYNNPAEIAVEKWMLSPRHKENLLGARWKESAVGVAITQDGTYYLTQVFIVRN